MRIKNTSQYNIAELKRLAKYIKGVKTQRVDVLVTMARGNRAYQGWAHFLTWKKKDKRPWYKITVRIGVPEKFPCFAGMHFKYKRYPIFTYENWQEAFVGVLAHELRHNQQFRLNKKASEIDAGKFEYKSLLRYREAIKEEVKNDRDYIPQCI